MKKGRTAGKVPPNPWHYAFQRLLTGACGGFALTLLLGALCFFVLGRSSGRDFVVGGLIAFIPQMWFLVRGFGRSRGQRAVALALAKYALSGAGFALWFALVPDAGAVVTLAGTTTAIFLMAVMTMGAMRRSLNG